MNKIKEIKEKLEDLDKSIKGTDDEYINSLIDRIDRFTDNIISMIDDYNNLKE